jgi:non-specific serine/threonine protein kinase
VNTSSAGEAGKLGLADDDATRISLGTHPGQADPTVLARPTPSDPPDDDRTVLRGDPGAGPAPQDDDATVLSAAAVWANGQADGAAPVPLRVGQLLKGRFQIVRELGRGGMGVVYLARDARKVEARDKNPYLALKVLNEEFRRHPDALVVLQRESLRAQRLAHDHIVRVFDFDKDGDVVFMTMEFIDGQDLRALLRNRGGSGMSLRQAWPLIQAMGQALARAHAAGIVHSDFKPGNVMVGKDGVAKVFDFGIARAAQQAGAEEEDDHAGFDIRSLGALTPAYASLSMLKGAEPALSDDVYAFACVVYELLHGQHPFARKSAELVQQQALRAPVIAGLGRRRNQLLKRCLSADASLRPSIEQVLRQLRPRSRLMRVLPWALATLVLAAGGVTLASWWNTHQRRQQADLVLAHLVPGRGERYDHEQPLAEALAAMDAGDRQQFILQHGQTLAAFLFARLDQYWQPSAGRTDYPGVQRVLALQDHWKLYSAPLNERRLRVEQERGSVLNALDTQMTAAIADNALLRDTPGNVVDLLKRMRSLQAPPGLLRQKELELKYLRGADQADAQGQRALAQQWLDSGREAFPDSGLLIERARAGRRASAQAQPEDAPEAALSEEEVASHVQSLRTAASALDVDKVREQLRAIAQLQPAHPVLAREGPRLLATAQLGRARELARLGQWQDAAEQAKAASLSDTSFIAARFAQARYGLAQSLAQEQVMPLPESEAMQASRRRVQRMRRQDPAGFSQFAQDVEHVSASPDGNAKVGMLLQVLKAASETAAAQVETRADPCKGEQASTRCRDSLGGDVEGPELVVLPGFRPALAMMQREVSAASLAGFCQQRQDCPDRGDGTVSRVSAELAQDYARWLSQATGHTYRLPTDAEWVRAARAGGGPAPCLAAISNRWGLQHMAGGVGEWVLLGGGSVGVRIAGDATVCQHGGAVVSDGKPDRKIGFRLVREIP